jgi:hypothetical protein
VHSTVCAAVLGILGIQVLLIGVLADLVGFNRRILEEVLHRLRRLELPERDQNSSRRREFARVIEDK